MLTAPPGCAERAPVAVPRDDRSTTPVGSARPAPRRLRSRLVAPLACSLVVQVVLAAGDRVPAVDTLSYLASGRSWLAGDGYARHGLPEVHFPPLTPIALAVLERSVGDEMTAVRIWNVSWGMAIVAVLTWLTWTISQDRDATVLCAWIAPVVPGVLVVAVRDGGGSELVAATSILAATTMVLRAFNDPHRSTAATIRRLAPAGLIVGIALLGRPESLVPAAMIACTATALAARSPRPPGSRAWSRPLLLAAAFVLPALALVAPYLAHQRSVTGSWSIAAKAQDASIEAWSALARDDRLARDQVLYEIGPDGTTLGPPPRPLSALAREDPAGWAAIASINARAAARALLVPSWEGGPRWALIPTIVLAAALHQAWTRRGATSTRLLVALAAWPLATCLAFFVMPRYLVLTAAALVPLAARGVVGWTRALPRRRATLVRAAVVLTCAPSLLGAAHPLAPGTSTPERVEQRIAGEWIAEHTPLDARIMTRSYHVQGYADRPVVAMPYADYDATIAFARRMGAQYLVADEATIRHRRPHLYRLLLRSRTPPAGLELVHQFEVRDQRVRIYRLTPTPSPSAEPPRPLGYVSD